MRAPALALMLCSLAACGQEESAVLGAIDRFFAAMTERDTAAMASTLLPGGSLHIAPRSGGDRARSIPFTDYLVQLAQGRQRLVERYWRPRVELAGPSIAVACMEYDFHADGHFSHCGVDVFTLVRQPDGWRIASVAFTRQAEGCRPSPLGPLRE
ncbi:MAG: nuclear transport factor 2 family protein [Flavobacteriales bacterium]